jgi:oligogalacturonide lyase
MVVALALSVSLRGATPPKQWIDPDTGHRIIRITDEPGTGSLYFNQNAYSKDGKKLIITTAHRDIATVDLSNFHMEIVVKGPVNAIVTGRKTGDVYYRRPDGMICATNLDTHATREIVNLPRDESVATINADETLLGGVRTERGGNEPFTVNAPHAATDGHEWTFAERKEISLHDRLHMRIPMDLIMVDTATGKTHVLLHSTDWLNHVQFSPSDPTLMMFCHEGPWHEVDRIWVIHTDGSGLMNIHKRTMNMEIAGHEFFSGDGKTIWYDLQTPRGEDFWVAGYELGTGKRTWYHLQRNEWSVHYNVSPDGKLFAGDGGDSEMVAHAPAGKWIYLFRPEAIPDVAGIKAPDAGSLIHPGVFRAERLVNMGKHEYHLEPNVTFSPDMKYVIFRSNMFGGEYVFAVEIESRDKGQDGKAAREMQMPSSLK